jgi:2-keto-4-pentenoate hydratase/2-oxohepta-3-ene-1,7-dioic acid hydratase in catechol pathway
MKLAMYAKRKEAADAERIGVLVGDGHIGDLQRAHQRLQGHGAAPIASSITALLASGDVGMRLATDAFRYLSEILHSGSAAELLTPIADCRLAAPLRPSKLIAVGRNYLSHTEAAGTKVEMQVPSAWIKANSAITGPMDDVIKPRATNELDYETELSIVIGRRCRNVPESRAFEVIAGYTIVNDISARDIARIERKEANQLLGKMFDTFAPMGPWMVTADEIRDPNQLRLQTRVNGEVRQDASTSTCIWTVSKLIAYISQMTLEPGDVITTGTPDGCAMGRKAGESSWYLVPGDILESEVEGVGVMRNRIVAAPDEQVSWRW